MTPTDAMIDHARICGGGRYVWLVEDRTPEPEVGFSGGRIAVCDCGHVERMDTDRPIKRHAFFTMEVKPCQ